MVKKKSYLISDHLKGEHKPENHENLLRYLGGLIESSGIFIDQNFNSINFSILKQQNFKAKNFLYLIIKLNLLDISLAHYLKNNLGGEIIIIKALNEIRLIFKNPNKLGLLSTILKFNEDWKTKEEILNNPIKSHLVNITQNKIKPYWLIGILDGSNILFGLTLKTLIETSYPFKTPELTGKSTKNKRIDSYLSPTNIFFEMNIYHNKEILSKVNNILLSHSKINEFHKFSNVLPSFLFLYLNQFFKSLTPQEFHETDLQLGKLSFNNPEGTYLQVSASESNQANFKINNSYLNQANLNLSLKSNFTKIENPLVLSKDGQCKNLRIHLKFPNLGLKNILQKLDETPLISLKYIKYLKLRKIYRICQRKENLSKKGILKILSLWRFN